MTICIERYERSKVDNSGHHLAGHQAEESGRKTAADDSRKQGQKVNSKPRWDTRGDRNDRKSTIHNSAFGEITREQQKKGKTSGKKAAPEVNQIQPETTIMMNPAEFTLPNVMYFNVGTAENPIMQAFTSGPNVDNSGLAQPGIEPLEVQQTVNLVESNSNLPILSASQIASGEQTEKSEKTAGKRKRTDQTASEQTNSMFSPKTSNLANQLMLEEKARKAAAEKKRIIGRPKKMTPVRFKKHSKIVANHLLSAQ